MTGGRWPEGAALVWVVNLGTIEVHGLLSRLPDVERHDTLLFDLDPGEGAGLAQCCTVALRLRGHSPPPAT